VAVVGSPHGHGRPFGSASAKGLTKRSHAHYHYEIDCQFGKRIKQRGYDTPGTSGHRDLSTLRRPRISASWGPLGERQSLAWPTDPETHSLSEGTHRSQKAAGASQFCPPRASTRIVRVAATGHPASPDVRDGFRRGCQTLDRHLCRRQSRGRTPYCLKALCGPRGWSRTIGTRFYSPFHGSTVVAI
jgi:hypothetical protein